MPFDPRSVPFLNAFQVVEDVMTAYCISSHCLKGNQGRLLRLRLSQAMVGGLTISLNKAVPQTSNAKPATWSHLKVSQPSPSETSQMNSVRQVSMVLRAVADIWRVTERPKKLKPL